MMLSDEARKARCEYKKAYYRRNKEKCKQWEANYWEKIAKKIKAEKQKTE